MRIAEAAITMTIETPYAASSPSVSSERPNSRAITTPIAAAATETTRNDDAVSAPVASEPRPDEPIRLRTDAEAYAPCRTTPSGQRAR